jgi:hypothetical protein
VVVSRKSAVFAVLPSLLKLDAKGREELGKKTEKQYPPTRQAV